MSGSHESVKRVVIIGAGPAGLAAGYRLCDQGMDTLIVEQDSQVGGLSRTIRYKGNYFDIGGHRFFTKNKEVLTWWQDLLKEDLLKIPRSSKIYYQDTFFNYPLSVRNVLANIGWVNAFLIPLSYLKSRLFPQRKETNFEQWIVNRFGRKLYQLFFKEYTEKVWGIPCRQISSDWASERIKGLSLSTALRNALSGGRNNTVKTLIKEFLFPRFGSGMMYEAIAQKITEKGGEVKLRSEVIQIKHDYKRIKSLVCKDSVSGSIFEVGGSDFCSSMPITSLVARMDPPPGRFILETCQRLRYRSMVMVYCIVDRKDLSPDNWIYVHSPQVRVARIQNFRKWSPAMVAGPDKASLGMEYFCDEGDAFWSLSDRDLIDLGVRELEKLKLATYKEVTDGYVLRVPKAYPIYDDGYRQALAVIKDFVSGFSNLQCIGRYGMFQYTNMDRSTLIGFLAAKNILGAHEDLWSADLGEACND
ncbi:MAG TPA: NAD(P)/FAD-dependent oxidoreductase [Candidatus Omnitrophota bacterium]|nr:NAD(P)/FAD-dependent oxidoreductase [Candidatus Omnitrophota bacterium]HPD84853.1 NAD(P)/FAD-dependent oxidoreductase [Candidatus Omnitrophota bacterium]HRZ03711.1 NAD(P)/FAD-dependent oxidoreductase [Candidatus Omnitrophota bacterium]